MLQTKPGLDFDKLRRLLDDLDCALSAATFLRESRFNNGAQTELTLEYLLHQRAYITKLWKRRCSPALTSTTSNSAPETRCSHEAAHPPFRHGWQCCGRGGCLALALPALETMKDADTGLRRLWSEWAETWCAIGDAEAKAQAAKIAVYREKKRLRSV